MQEGVLQTAIELDEDTLKQAEKRFSAYLGDEVHLTQKLDPSLLGGARVHIAGRVYDDSLSGQLDAIRDALLNGIHSGEIGSLGGKGDKMPAPDEAVDAAIESAEGDKIPPAAAGDIGGIIASAQDGALKTALLEFQSKVNVRGAGTVISSADGIVRITGLGGVRNGELVDFGDDIHGIAMNLLSDEIDVVLLNGEDKVAVGRKAMGTGRVLSIPVGDGIIGRVVNPLGEPLDGGPKPKYTEMRPLENPAPTIIDRMPVTRPLETGLIAVDSMIPIGMGQRELIIGDRQTGKTSIAMDAILNQKGKHVYCVYVAIGQKASTVAQVIETFRKAGAMDYTCVVCSTASDTPTMQYTAPYAGCAIAEYFMYSGRDAFIVYDDLSKHAVAYRAMSLLLKRPPGREAYPGDVFYLHSRLLERSAQLSAEKGGGSMTALPIIETQTGDISAYIPTNVISITDGQLYLDTDMFRAGQRPAINVGLSVSRVGGAAQGKPMRKVAGQLRLQLAQYRELQVFSQFSSDMDEGTKETLMYGERLNDMLRQPNHSPLQTAVQVALLYAVSKSLLGKDVPMKELESFKKYFPQFMLETRPELAEMIDGGGQYDENITAALEEAVKEYVANKDEIAAKQEESENAQTAADAARKAFDESDAAKKRVGGEAQ